MWAPVGMCRVPTDCYPSLGTRFPHLSESIGFASWHTVCLNHDMSEQRSTAMIGRQTEKHLVFTVVDQPDRQAPAGRLNRSGEGSRGFQTRRRRKRSAAEMRLKPVYNLTMVCAWCKGTQNAEGSWGHAENAPQTDVEIAVSHGICPECAEKSYNEYRLATFAANAHLASARTRLDVPIRRGRQTVVTMAD